MTYTRVGFWKSFIFLTFILILLNPGAIWGQARPRIVQRVDNEQRVTLKGNVHPMATVKNDRGAVSDAQPVGRILLLLKRGDEQQAALSSFMEQQQDKSSPNYHHWLAPAEFGAQYGVADEDIQTVTQWLTQQGFQVNQVYSSKMEIEFSGNAAQVRSAFGTELRNFQLGGKTYVANSADPQIPAALAPVIAGIVSLNNFPRQSYKRRLGQFWREKGQSVARPLVTFPSPYGNPTIYPVGPADFATIYNSAPLIAASNDGTGQTIAIVGETNINLQDVQNFRQMFGLPNTFTAANIILNGEDPGITSQDEESEADLDVQWSGAVAPGATVKFVVSASTPASAGIDLSALYIIEHNLAGVMSESYGACEVALGSAGNAFYNSIWEQAAAQGITVALSSGDGGSAGCDNFNAESAATSGLAVSGFASTLFNVAVGGTDFDQMNQQSTYWNPTNDPVTGASAKGYIPEIPWNENCAQLSLTACPNAAAQYQNIVAGSGGPSSRYSKPAWQMGVTGMPSDSKRDLPDISLLASPGFNGTGYIICQEDVSPTGDCDLTVGGIRSFSVIGGTSASSPAFAGVMALVNQYQAAHSGSPRQGNANYVLYALSKKSGASCTSAVGEAASCIFNDVTHGNSAFTGSVGTNSVPCQGGTLNCSVTTGSNVGVLVDSTKKEAWTTNAGYDMVTGLGSLNVQNLAHNWGSVSTVATTTTLTLTPVTGITHGTTENVAVGITVTPASGTATGVVSLIANMPDGSTRGVDDFSLVNGVITGAKTKNLPGGAYTVTAHYTGDGTNAPSDSAPISVTVAPESSQTFIVIPTFDSSGRTISGNASTITYGTQYIIRMYVTDKTGTLNPNGAPGSTCDQTDRFTCPTGTVTLASGGSPVDQGTFSLNSAGYTRDIVPMLQGGTYSLVATYGGDSSFNASTSAAHTFTVTPATLQLSLGVPNSTLVGSLFTIYMTGTSNVAAPPPMGTLTLYDGTTVLLTVTGAAQLGGYSGTGSNPGPTGTSGFGIDTGIELSALGAHSLTLTYSGDPNYSAASTSPQIVHVVYPTSLALQSSATTVNYGNSLTLTATLTTTRTSPPATGQITFTSSNGQGTTIAVGPTTQTTVNGFVALQATATVTLQSSDSFTATYAGDDNYYFSSAYLSSVTVNPPDFNVTSSQPSLTITAGQPATLNITITPATAINASVQLQIPSPMQGITCNVSPLQIPISGTGSVTATLTCSVPAPSSSTSTTQTFPWTRPRLASRNTLWKLSGLLAALALALWVLPARLQLRRLACASVILSSLSFAAGCGGGGGSGGGGSGGGSTGGGSSGITATTTTLSVASTKVQPGSNLMATVQVNGTSPTGQATLGVVGLSYSMNTMPLTNSQAQFSYYLGSPGGYSMTAQYSGDSRNRTSQVQTPLSVVQVGAAGSLTVNIYVGPSAKQVSFPLAVQ